LFQQTARANNKLAFVALFAGHELPRNFRTACGSYFEVGARHSVRAFTHSLRRAADCAPYQCALRFRENSCNSCLFARSFGCGNDFVEALITAQIIPAWIE
jgi:hypothetical protein